MVGYIEFKERLQIEGCFSIHQARNHFPAFDRNSLTRWTKKGLLVRLRQGWYAFPDMIQRSEFSRYVAGKIYNPSYVSLRTALSIYGMIPDEVTSITSVTTLKTAHFENDFGQYSYQNVKSELFFGYKPVMLPPDKSTFNSPSQTWMLALPEKALLDLLYLYPFYDNEEELERLKLDKNFITKRLDVERLGNYLGQMRNKALDSRVRKLLKIYDL